MNIGTLTIELATNIARLQTEMGQAKSTVKSAMQEIEGAVNIAKTAFIGLTGIASIASFKAMVDGAIQAKVELARLSQQTGASVESLSTISAVAKLSGTNITDVASAMNKLQKSLATSNEDSKGAASAIKALGLNFDEFKKLSPDQQMLQVAQAMDKFQDGGGKSAAAMLLFGKSGAQLLPMLTELAEKQDLVGKQTAESAKQALEYEKNTKLMQLAGDDFKRQLVEDILPALTAVTKAMVDARKEGSGLFGSLAAGLGTFVTGDDRYKNNKEIVDLTERQLALQKAVDQNNAGGRSAGGAFAAEELKKVNEQLKTALSYRTLLDQADDKQAAKEKARADERKKNGDVPVKVPEPKTGATVADMYVANLAKEYANLTQSASKYNEVITVLDIKDNKFTETQKREAVALAKKIDLYRAAQMQVDSFAKAEEARQAAIDAADAAFSSGLAAMSQASKDYEFNTSLVGRSAAEIQRMTAVRAIDTQQMKIEADLGNARGEGLISQEEYLRRLNQTQQEANDLKEKQLELMTREEEQRTDPQKGINKALTDYQLTASRLGDSWGSLMTTGISGLEDRLSEFFSKGKTDWKSYFQSILMEAVRLQVVRPLLANIFTPGGLGGGFGGAQGAFSQTSAGSSGFGSGLAYGNQDLGGFFADGGRPPVGQPSVVGERGPELFVPDTAGTIVPNGGGGNTFAPVYHISIDARTDRAEVYSVVGRAMQENNQRFSEQLRQQGVIA